METLKKLKKKMTLQNRLLKEIRRQIQMQHDKNDIKRWFLNESGYWKTAGLTESDFEKGWQLVINKIESDLKKLGLNNDVVSF
jgi:hypothetical protein